MLIERRSRLLPKGAEPVSRSREEPSRPRHAADQGIEHMLNSAIMVSAKQLREALDADPDAALFVVSVRQDPKLNGCHQIRVEPHRVIDWGAELTEIDVDFCEEIQSGETHLETT